MSRTHHGVLRRHLLPAFFAAVLLAASAGAQSWPNVIYHKQKARAARAMPANRARVTADLEAAGRPSAGIAWYAVPAMSDVMRLADTYPEDGEVSGELQALIAQNEFEPVSFQLFAFDNLDGVKLAVSDLMGPGGAKIGGKDLDLRVVKVWFQNGNAWLSYFDDPGLKLVPELLLHDENLIKVDLEKEANYARVLEDGEEKWVWISSPRDYGSNGFDPRKEAFHDAETIQPVALQRDAFKQFILTIHAGKGQKPGTYRGKVSVAKGGKSLAEIPVAVRVLPFELPLPATYYDIDKPFVITVMGANGGDDPKMLQDYYDHGMYHVGFKHDKETVALMRKIGFPLDWVFSSAHIPWFCLNFGGRLSFDNVVTAKFGAEELASYWDNLVGHHNVLTAYGDEAGANFVSAHRECFKFFFDKGIKMGCAGHDPLFFKGGYIYENMPLGTDPDDRNRIDRWNQVGDKYLAFYACQHTGSENPQFVRYQHGLLGYLSGLSMVDNYEFATGPMNDRADEVYRPMVITYRNGDGLMETIQWSGFREGVDDMRYMTCLKRLAREAAEKGDTDARLTAKKALQFISLLPRDKPDLNAIRTETIMHILKIRKALEK
jgi:hypothetical protein